MILEYEKNWFCDLRDSGFPFPSNYLVSDLETTGLSSSEDFILQAGYLYVENGIPLTPIGLLFNWYTSNSIDLCRFDDINAVTIDERWDIQTYSRNKKIDEYNTKIKGTDKPPKAKFNRVLDPNLFIEYGFVPERVLEVLHERFTEHQAKGGYFLGHNLAKFDSNMFEMAFKRFLGKYFYFNIEQIIDTGLLQKAVGANIRYKKGESLNSFYLRIGRLHSRVKWSLSDYCIDKYALDKKYPIDKEKAHQADADCLATHYLFHEYKLNFI